MVELRRPRINKWVAVGVVLMFTVTMGASAYAYNYGKAELYHFWVAAPAGNVTAPMVMRGPGPPLNLAPVAIDLAQRGFLKNFLQPNIEGLSTHWIYNYGFRPVRIQMELTNLTIAVKWEVNCNHPYDPINHTFTAPLGVGKSILNLGIDWIFDIPSEMLGQDIIYNGGLKLTDADTHALLTFIPIAIGNNLASNPGVCH